jgi:flagellar biosynthesis/type III secretory pathway protein FliH
MPSDLKTTIRLTAPLKGVRVSYYGPETLRAAEVAVREEEAYARGHADAEAATQRQIVDARLQMKRLQDEVLEAISQRFNEFSRQFDAQMPDLVLSIVRKVWAGLELDREAILRVIDATLGEMAPGGGDMELCLSPRDAALLQDVKDFQTRYTGLRLVTDDTLRSGDVVLRCRFGVVDGRVETKIRHIEDEIREVHA